MLAHIIIHVHNRKNNLMITLNISAIFAHSIDTDVYDTVLNLILRMEKNNFNFEKCAFFW